MVVDVDPILEDLLVLVGGLVGVHAGDAVAAGYRDQQLARFGLELDRRLDHDPRDDAGVALDTLVDEDGRGADPRQPGQTRFHLPQLQPLTTHLDLIVPSAMELEVAGGQAPDLVAGGVAAGPVGRHAEAGLVTGRGAQIAPGHTRARDLQLPHHAHRQFVALRVDAGHGHPTQGASQHGVRVVLHPRDQGIDRRLGRAVDVPGLTRGPGARGIPEALVHGLSAHQDPLRHALWPLAESRGDHRLQHGRRDIQCEQALVEGEVHEGLRIRAHLGRDRHERVPHGQLEHLFHRGVEGQRSVHGQTQPAGVPAIQALMPGVQQVQHRMLLDHDPLGVAGGA